MLEAETPARPMDWMLWRTALSGLCATLVGVGLSRFAYSALIPALIEGGWFSPGGADYLAATNLVGYVVGALLARRLAAGHDARRMLRLTMVGAAATLFLCGVRPDLAPGGFAWFCLWRLLAGVIGGVIMIVAAQALLAGTPPARRGLVSGIVFTGVGLGTALSATLVSIALPFGIVATWWSLGVAALLLTALAWNGWPALAPLPARPAQRQHRGIDRLAVLLLFTYGCNAAGLVPHMVFLVDYVARGLGRGLPAGALAWLMMGIGATAGPMITGYVGGRIGFARAARFGMLIQAGFVILPVVAPLPPAIIVSALVIGAFAPGTIPMALGRATELAGTAGQARLWSGLTMTWALSQTTAAWIMSYLFAHGSGYAVLFEIGMGLLLLGYLCENVAERWRSTRLAVQR